MHTETWGLIVSAVVIAGSFALEGLLHDGVLATGLVIGSYYARMYYQNHMKL